MKRAKDIDPNIARALKMLRMRSGFTLKQVSPGMGVSQQVLSRRETATAMWRDEDIDKFLYEIRSNREALARELASVQDEPEPEFRERSSVWDHFPADLEVLKTKDESMSPWVEPGEKVYYQRGEHPRRFEGCVVEKRDGTRLIRLYEREKDGHMHLRRVNPDKTESILSSEIIAVHKIVLRGT